MTGSWWQNNKRLLIIYIIVLIVILIVVSVLVRLFGWDWTGFAPYTPPTHVSNFQRGKTLWDLLQLLIVPAVLAIAGFSLNQIQKSREEKTTKQRTEDEQKIATDNQREAALQAYIDKMSELLVHGNLRGAGSESEVNEIARVRTLTVLPRLDKVRKKSVLQFLYESGLISKDKRIISLRGADLSEAALSSINLSEVDLREAYLSSADLNSADLSDADLSGAILEWAKLPWANLSRTKLTSSGVSWKPRTGSKTINRANLHNADLHEAILVSADLSKAFLYETNLTGANLTDAKLTDAILVLADLTNTVLVNADLSGTNLSEAKVTQEQWEQAKSLKDATMPDGSKHL